MDVASPYRVAAKVEFMKNVCLLSNPSSRLIGFTVIELLTVVAIVSILSGLLMAGMVKSRGKARMVLCINNHKQLQLAWQFYASDHNGRLVTNSDNDEMNQGASWVFGVLYRESVGTNQELLINPEVSLLAPYAESADLYKCPSDESEYVRSVSMNCRLNPQRFDGNPNWVGGRGAAYMTFRTLSDIRQPSNVLAIMDERRDSINDAFFGIDMSNTGSKSGVGFPQPYWLIDYPGDYHGDGMVASFADGHVERHGWVDFVKMLPVRSGHRPLRSDPSNADVRWLQEHCTYLR